MAIDRRSFLRTPHEVVDLGVRNGFVESAEPAPRPETQPPAPGSLGISAGLEAHATPLAEADVKHALRRCAFGAKPELLEAWTGSTATELANALVDESVAMPLPDETWWANEAIPGRGSTQEERRAYRDANNQWLLEYRMDWMQRMMRDGLRERLALVWHNHFVTGVSSYRYAVFSFRYVQTLRTYALGNFKEFVRYMGLDPSMLLYLNGIQNRVGTPNENYARELLELFTMGPVGPDGTPNYTENDIRELARALTGFQVSATTLGPVFTRNRFDDGFKEIFGRFENFNYASAIDLIFAERAEAIAHFVCRHLYASLVYSGVDDAVVSSLATQLLDANWELEPVIRTLLASAHFFDPQAQGAQIKSPVEHALGMPVEMDIAPTMQTLNVLYRTARANGQNLLDPPNVAGWPGHHIWMNTTTLPYRWFVSEVFLSGRGGTAVALTPLAQRIHDELDPEAAFRLPLALVEHLIAAPVDLLDIPEISDEFGGDLVNFPIPEWVNAAPPHVRNLAKMFLGGQPWYEWGLHVQGAEERMTSFVRQISQYPEYQLV
ncbi:MAG: DUF1800 family protein [Rhodothermales bacterium]|nr:DUF1800 family protein [Rhodothermales bacterium]MBO6779817.1 DUF1800 family protein [Rhodothermales bacterium]